MAVNETAKISTMFLLLMTKWDTVSICSRTVMKNNTVVQ